MKISNKMKTQIKKRLTSATAILAVLVLVFACSKNIFNNIKTEVNVSTVVDTDKASGSSADVIKDSTGVHVKVSAQNNDGVRRIEILKDDVSIEIFNYSGLTRSEMVDIPIVIPFGYTNNIKVKVDGILIKDENVQNMRCISTAADMVAFRNAVNAGDKFQGKYVELTNDIDMSSVCSSTNGSWVAIGKMNSPNDLGSIYFAGTLNGNYHKISNLYVNQSSVHYAGLFGYVCGGTICNLIMKNVSVYNGYNSTASAQTRTAAIAAMLTSSSYVHNCGIESGTVQAKYTLSPGSWNLSSIGGIAGGSYTSVIDGCYNKATIISSKNNSTGCTNRIGGIAGDVASRNVNK